MEPSTLRLVSVTSSVTGLKLPSCQNFTTGASSEQPDSALEAAAPIAAIPVYPRKSLRFMAFLSSVTSSFYLNHKV